MARHMRRLAILAPAFSLAAAIIAAPTAGEAQSPGGLNIRMSPAEIAKVEARATISDYLEQTTNRYTAIRGHVVCAEESDVEIGYNGQEEHVIRCDNTSPSAQEQKLYIHNSVTETEIRRFCAAEIARYARQRTSRAPLPNRTGPGVTQACGTYVKLLTP